MHHILVHNKFSFFHFGIFTIFNSLILQFLNRNMPHHVSNSMGFSVTEQYLAPQGMPLKPPRQLKEKNLAAII